jgi:hypothetical protein
LPAPTDPKDMAMNTNEHGSGLWASGAARAAALLACVLLAGCASVHSAQDKVGGWVEGLGEEAPEQSPPPAEATEKKATARKVTKKPAVSTAPALSAPDAMPESVANDAPGETAPDASSDTSDPGVEPEAPESSIFDPY